MFNKLGLYWRTLRHLKRRQITYRLFYLARGRWRSLLGYEPDWQPKAPTAQPLTLKGAVTNYTTFLGRKEFRFLAQSYAFESTGINWNWSGYGKLWTYNLTYFEYLHQVGLSKEEGLYLINDFIDKLPIIKDGLEPFPISLRAVNWIKFIVKHNIRNERIDRALYAQLYVLADKPEYHLLGNHLLENGVGLLFGAYYFADAQLYHIAKQILESELLEQVQADGAHFEQSPMYHQLMLYRILDMVNLVQCNPRVFATSILPLLQQQGQLMLSWLHKISWPNGTIPLINDSTIGVAPTTQELSTYAKNLALSSADVPLGISGYRRLSSGLMSLLFDAGNIGPDYIPGHAHSDSLSILLRIADEDILVDTGISTYEKNKRRQYERSTAAHNTVQLGNEEQSEVWGGFRVGRRAYTEILLDEPTVIKARHNGHLYLGQYHMRTIKSIKNGIQIKDELTKPREAIARFHLAHGIQAELVGSEVRLPNCVFQFTGAKKVSISDYHQAISFNTIRQAKLITVSFSKPIVTTITHHADTVSN